MKNQGISLIALIITIIVIIILAAIVIFTGLGTPDSAQFSAFTNDCDTVYMAVLNRFSQLKVDHAISGDYRTNEQIYIEVARGEDPNQYAVMNTDTDPTNNKSTTATSIPHSSSTGCQQIIAKGIKDMGLTKLPTVRQDQGKYWYVTQDGRVFNSTGYEYNGKTYYNATYYADGVQATNHDATKASAIAHQINSGDGFVVDLDWTK